MAKKYLDYNGLDYFWDKIDNKKQNKLTAGSNITISGSTISASQPTVNNGTLTIQKNGTNVQTFTANQSTNVTANIVVPTKTSDITNDSNFVTSSGTVAKANQLTTPRTIGISGGATGTVTSFNGTANISIPITSMKEAYLEWGGKSLSGQTSPVDAAVDPFIGSNKWAFANAASFVYEYSTDGGATWVDCGISDANRRAVTTTSGGYTIRLGNNSTTNYAKNKLRLTFNSNAAGGNVYTSLRKILIYLSTNGATGTTVTVTSRTIGNYRNNVDTWTTVGTYNVSGWSGWNSIPYDVPFGGGASQTGQIAQIRLTFNQSGGTANMSVSHVHFIGVTNWGVPSELGKTGHLYTWDVDQNATFPASVSVTGSLKHGNYTYTLPNKNGTFALTSDIPSVPTVNNGTLTIQKNGSNVATFTANQSGNSTANIVVPTKTSDITNDSNFPVDANYVHTDNNYTTTEKNKLSGIASGAEVNVQSDWSVTDTSSDAFIKNKPTIPTVNNATLTIQKNGTNVQTFTANSSSNKTANITVPTKTSDLTNDSGFVDATAIAGKQDLLTAGDHINITGTTIKAVDYVHSEQPVATQAVTPVVTGSMISNGTITADKLASGATVQLTLSNVDIGEGSALAVNTLYGVYR